VADLKPQKLSLFARIDRYNDPCPDCSGIDYLPIDTSAKFTMFLAGAEYYLIPAVRFSPNVEWVAYGTPAQPGSPAPKDDIGLAGDVLLGLVTRGPDLAPCGTVPGTFPTAGMVPGTFSQTSTDL